MICRSEYGSSGMAASFFSQRHQLSKIQAEQLAGNFEQQKVTRRNTERTSWHSFSHICLLFFSHWNGVCFSMTLMWEPAVAAVAPSLKSIFSHRKADTKLPYFFCPIQNWYSRSNLCRDQVPNYAYSVILHYNRLVYLHAYIYIIWYNILISIFILVP